MSGSMQRASLPFSVVLAAVRPERVVPPDGAAERFPRLRAVACHPGQINGPGTLFAAMDEFLEYNRWLPWHTFIAEAVGRDEVVAAIVPQRIPGWNIPQLVTRNPRAALGRAAAAVTGMGRGPLWCCGVTGTNGKTTTVHLLTRALQELGESAGSLGTLGVYHGRERLGGTEFTTPLAPVLFEELGRLAGRGIHSAAMEVSSHGLALDRLAGLGFDAAVVTNLERDHLDFHGTVEAYRAAKQRLVQQVRPGGICILNHCLPERASFEEVASAPVLTYGPAGSGADLEYGEPETGPEGSRFRVTVKGQEALVESRLAGAFQVENVCAAVLVLWWRGFGLEAIGEAVRKFPGVSGRMERFRLPCGGTAFVDYAHNPDGLGKVLAACRPLARGRLQVVFGCGGDRDRGKRAEMGALAARWADVCWVTSDNPRTEDPGSIVADILEGMPPEDSRIRVVPDRAEAIRRALAESGSGDVLLVAGKGHEDYQIIGHRKMTYSDQGELRRGGAVVD